jgi:hypothetical protein
MLCSGFMCILCMIYNIVIAIKLLNDKLLQQVEVLNDAWFFFVVVGKS